MKIRTGFVSNSSSSSFVLLVEEQWYNACFEELSDYDKHVVKNCLVETTDILGVTCKVFEGSRLEDYSSLEDLPKHKEEENIKLYYEIIEMRDDAFERFEEKIFKDKTKVYCHTVDF